MEVRSTYQAFVSYSHAADGKLSPAVQSGLHRFARAWYQRRAMRVFRDKTSLSATPALWGSIQHALERSEYFLLLASPQAAQSPWVRREIEWWLKNRPVERLLILLTHGEIAWDSGVGDFDWTRTTAVPEVLRGRFNDEPLHIDFRWADSPDKLSLRHTQFRAAILDVAATLRGVAKDELDGEDVRQHRRTRTLAAVMVMGILAFAIVAAWQAYIATVQRAIATTQRNTALSRLLAAESLRSATDVFRHLEVALLQGVAAYRVLPTVEARRSIMTALLETNRVKRFVRTTDTLASLALSPDGRTIAIGDTRGTITLWDTETLRPTLELQHGSGFVVGLSFSRDGSRLASVDSRQAVLWNLSSGRASKGPTLAAQERLTNVAWSTDGATVYANDRVTRRWDSVSGVEHTALGVNAGLTPRRLAVSPDGKTIATAGDDSAVALWDTATGRLRRTLQGRSQTVTSLAFNQDGSLLASGGEDGRITIWVLSSGSMRAVLDRYRAAVDTIAFSPDGHILAAGDRDRMVILWNLATGEPGEILPGHTNGLMQLVFTPDGRELVAGGFEDMFIVWNLGVTRQRTLLAGHRGDVRHVVTSPDGTMLASAGDDGTIRLWDLERRQARAVLTGHRGEVGALAFNRVSGVLVSGGEDRRIRFWDTGSRAVLQEVDAHGEVESLAISPDGKTLAWAVSATGPIFLWDIASREEPRELRGHDTEADSLEFSRDGGVLVSAGGSTIRVWDARTGREVSEPMEADTVVRATISPDGRTIASSQTSPNAVLLWPLQSDENPIELPTENFNSDHHPAFSPDGKMLAYSAGEAAIRVVLTTLDNRGATWTLDMPASVEAITFTPDGKRLVTGHSNGQVGIWDADIERWPEHACEIANRNLTRAEWKEFVGEALPYQLSCPALAGPTD